LVRKTPLGPFSESQVKEQLAKGFIRINDLAYQLPETKTTEPAEWRFLWQYKEFDRRRSENQNDPAVKPMVERRSPVNRERMEKEKFTQLSPELMALTQKDLVSRARNAWAKEKNEIPETGPTVEEASRNRRLGYLYWSMAIIIGMTILPAILRRSGVFHERAAANTVRPTKGDAHITTFGEPRGTRKPASRKHK
jgi:hypothetical protein